MIFDYETLVDLFDSEGEDFAAWATSSGYDSTWTDEMIYENLPGTIKEGVIDWVMNTSWWHEGM